MHFLHNTNNVITICCFRFIEENVYNMIKIAMCHKYKYSQYILAYIFIKNYLLLVIWLLIYVMHKLTKET